VRNDEVAGVLNEIADLLEMSDPSDRFRPIAYRRAARAIESLPEDVGDLANKGGLESIPGVGKAIAGKIKQYLSEGKVDALETLRQEFPPGLVEIMRVRDIGPKTARRLYFELKITSLDELRKAAEAGRLRKLKGFGEKTEQNILRGIEVSEQAKGRQLLGVALPIAERILAHLRANAPVENVTYAGSLRRMKETIGDIDLLATTRDPAAVTKAFTSMPGVREVVAAGDTKSAVVIAEGLQVDLRVLEPSRWGAGLQYFTGNKDHNVKLRGMAQKKGFKLNEYGLFREDLSEELVAAATEEDVYGSLGLPYIEPELREDAGEIEAALADALPDLVTLEDIRGDLHAHTNLTDGVNTLEEMAAAARAKGYAYLGISDHSPYVRVANGLSVENARIHIREIRTFSERSLDLKLLAGTECDILPDGSLDYPDDLLAEFDYVIASIHSNFKMSQEEMTRRVVRAMANENVDIIAHPTSRKIGQREPIALDMERFLEAAVETRTVLEINAYPDRTDLSSAHARLAKERGATLIVDTDSHSTEQLDYMRLGVGTARRGWVEKADLVNTMSFEDILSFFR
jgi:DNA polymerase (family 10)